MFSSVQLMLPDENRIICKFNTNGSIYTQYIHHIYEGYDNLYTHKYSTLVNVHKRTSGLTVLINTDRGVLTTQEAINQKVGGRLLCSIIILYANLVKL